MPEGKARAGRRAPAAAPPSARPADEDLPPAGESMCSLTRRLRSSPCGTRSGVHGVWLPCRLEGIPWSARIVPPWGGLDAHRNEPGEWLIAGNNGQEHVYVASSPYWRAARVGMWSDTRAALRDHFRNESGGALALTMFECSNQEVVASMVHRHLFPYHIRGEHYLSICIPEALDFLNDLCTYVPPPDNRSASGSGTRSNGRLYQQHVTRRRLAVKQQEQEHSRAAEQLLQTLLAAVRQHAAKGW